MLMTISSFFSTVKGIPFLNISNHIMPCKEKVYWRYTKLQHHQAWMNGHLPSI